VRYYATPGEARGGGFRACKRCRPEDADGRPPAFVAALVGELERDPALRLRDADLRARGLDPARVRRAFLRHYGLTFQAYARRRRLGEAFGRLQDGEDLDEVVLDHGFESYSGFREAYGRTFGQAPGRSRGADCVRLDWVESPIGPLALGATAQGVCLLEFGDRDSLEAQVARLRKRLGGAVVPGDNAHLERLRAELEAYFEGRLRRFSVPLVMPGTPFQERVWRALSDIPYGETRSYEDVAVAVGSPAAVRAVGLANGRNPVAIVVPCHRVVRKGGQLGGYGGGLWRKQRLLELEGAQGVLLPDDGATPLPMG
jgi:AraC family transcriptional regulator of adaptative response/methylated-DNA-[protein]-cysteine methyltransferase